MPYSEEAEKAVLSALIIESMAINIICDILKPEMFYDTRNQDLYRLLLSMFENNIKIDIVSVTNELGASGINISVEYILDITSQITTSANIERHAYYIKEKYIQRQLIAAGYYIQKNAMDNSCDISDLLEKSEKEIEDIITGAINNDNTVEISEAAELAYEGYLARNNDYLAGNKFNITSGFFYIDKYTGGFEKGNLIILAARPAMGKTSVLLHMAKKVSEQGKNPVIFSLEMTRESLAARLFFSYEQINSDNFKSGCLSKEDSIKLYNAKERILRLNMTINDSSDISIRKIKNISLQLKKRGKCDIIYIDYLQLIDMRGENNTYNREQEVAQVSRKCKIMAKELNVPVVLLSQLNRECEKRADKIPLLSDLRESGAVEQDADIILFIHRPEYYADPGEIINGECVQSGKGFIIIAKNRNGKTGKTVFYYDQTLSQISDEQIDLYPF